MVAALATLGLVIPAAATAPLAHVRTLAVSPHAIQAFAQDGGRVAWFTWPNGRCGGVFVRSVAGGSVARLPIPGGRTCRWPVRRLPVTLALAGRTAAWALLAAGNISEQWVFRAALGNPKERELAAFFHDTEGPGEWLTGLVGDRGRLAYSVTRTSYDEAGTLSMSGTVTVVGGGTIPVAAAKLTLDGDLVLTAAATGVSRGESPVAGPGARIEVWRAGRSVGWVASPGIVRELAFSYPYVVAFVTLGGERSLMQFDLGRGLSRMMAVAPNASSLSADGTTAVFRTGTRIFRVDLATGRRRSVVRAGATPVGLSIDGIRVAWAENHDGRGIVRALTLNSR